VARRGPRLTFIICERCVPFEQIAGKDLIDQLAGEWDRLLGVIPPDVTETLTQIRQQIAWAETDTKTCTPGAAAGPTPPRPRPPTPPPTPMDP
jgi:hypothetical protein